MLGDAPQWYVIHTKPRQENRADSNLRAWNIEIFNPKWLESCYDKNSGKLASHEKPLFPRYIFAYFSPDEMLRNIRFTRGVHRIVSFGERPTPVDGEIIKLIRSQINEHGFVRVGEEFSRGDKVEILDGPFRNFTAIFEQGTNDSRRVMLLLMAVNYQAHITVPRGTIKKAI